MGSMSLNLSSYAALMRDLQSLQHQSRAKYSLSALTMAAPLILTCCLCSLFATLYTISEERMTFVDSQEQVSFYCTKILYVHMMNGVCSRGQTTDIDVESSCYQWTDSETWEGKDDFNALMYNNGTAGYVETNMADEVKTTWPFIGLLCQISVGLAVANLVIATISLDTDILYTKLKIDDPDLVVLSTSLLCTGGTLACIGYSAYLVRFDSEIVEAESWKNEECEMTTDPTLGSYIFLVGGFFTLLSTGIATVALVRLYVVVPLLKRQKTVRDSSSEEAKAKRKEGTERDLEAASPGSSSTLVAGAGVGAGGGGAGYGIDLSDDGSKSSDATGASVMLSSDEDSDYGDEKEREVRVPGKGKTAGGGTNDFGSPVSIIDSVEGSLKMDSPRSPKPTPPTKPPRPVKSKKKDGEGEDSIATPGPMMPSVVGGGGGEAVDREVEAVPFSPPSGVNTPTVAAQEAPGSTLAERTREKPRKTPRKNPAAAAGGAGGAGAGMEKSEDKDAEINRLKAALAAAEAAKAVAADVSASTAAKKIARKVKKKKPAEG